MRVVADQVVEAEAASGLPADEANAGQEAQPRSALVQGDAGEGCRRESIKICPRVQAEKAEGLLHVIGKVIIGQVERGPNGLILRADSGRAVHSSRQLINESGYCRNGVICMPCG